MSHNIEIVNGRKSMFSVGATDVWHDPNGATKIADAPSLAEGLLLMNANYHVVTLPLEATLEDGRRVQSPNMYGILRTDTGAMLGTVSKVYEPVDNVTVFGNAMQESLDSGLLSLETGGVLGVGQRAWLMSKVNPSFLSAKAQEALGNGIIPYFAAIADHTGTARIKGRATTVRIVCSNTLRMSEVNKVAEFAVRHSGGAAEKVRMSSAELLSGITQQYDRFADEKALLEALNLNEDEFRALVVAPAIGAHPTQRPEWNGAERMANSVVDRYEKRAEAITYTWEHGAGHEGNGSAWEAYNGLVEVVDHNKQLFPARSGVYRTASLLDGVLAQTKTKVLDRILDYAERGTALDQILAQAELTRAA